MRRPFCSVILVSELAIVVPAASANGGSGGDSDANTRQVLAEIQQSILQLPEYGVFDSLSFAMLKDGSVVLRGKAVNPDAAILRFNEFLDHLPAGVQLIRWTSNSTICSAVS